MSTLKSTKYCFIYSDKLYHTNWPGTQGSQILIEPRPVVGSSCEYGR